MKSTMWLLVLFGLVVLVYPTTCYVRARVAVAECIRSCGARGLEMSSYISDNPLDAFANGQCVCLAESNPKALPGQ